MRHVMTYACCLLLLSGCGSLLQNTSSGPKQMYLDVNLGFAISYPEEWAAALRPVTLKTRTDRSVTWSIDHTGEEELLLVFRVISCRPESVRGGFEFMEQEFLNLNPNITLTGRQRVELAAGPAVRLSGYSPQRTYHAWLVTTYRRAFIISTGTAPEYFHRYENRFAEIVGSLEVIDQP